MFKIDILIAIFFQKPDAKDAILLILIAVGSISTPKKLFRELPF